MYLYNVTTNIDESIEAQWLQWMRELHIPAVIGTGKFHEATICKVMVQEEMGGVTYAVQYQSKSFELIEAYQKEEAIDLENEAQRIFGDKQLSFRTTLEVISTQ
jgi:hypothetical protein